jgi:hypothetical protein
MTEATNFLLPITTTLKYNENAKRKLLEEFIWNSCKML